MDLRRGIDRNVVKREIDERVQEGDNLQNLGEQFARDKAQLEQALENVENARISDADKQAMKAELYRALEDLQEQYEEDVEEKEEELEEAFEETIDDMQDAADELEQQAADLRGIRMEVSRTDAASAAEVAAEKQREFEEMMADANQKLDLQIQQMNQIRQNIRSRRLGGR